MRNTFLISLYNEREEWKGTPHTALIEIVSSAVQLNIFTVTINHELILILTVASSVFVPKRLLVKVQSHWSASANLNQVVGKCLTAAEHMYAFQGSSSEG